MKYKQIAFWILLASLLLSGCSMMTIDQMYCLPKRSDSYNNLQTAIDTAMLELDYCAPVSGENQQTVQIADLDGDGALEYLIFAKGTQAQPLRILVFRNVDGDYIHIDTIKSNGTEFDRVEYVKMDNSRSTLLVVGRKISDELMRTLTVYTYSQQGIEQLMSVNYREFLPTDLNSDGLSELFVLRSGMTETDNGIAEFYSLENGEVKRSNEVNLSQPADNLKRILVGKLEDSVPSVYAASASEKTGIITDVFTIRDNLLANITSSGNTDIVSALNHYVYANDIDSDGVLELPEVLIQETSGRNSIRWYGVNQFGEKINKAYTYHNFVDGWYLLLDNEWANVVTVSSTGNRHDFYVFEEDCKTSQRILSIFKSDNQSWEGSGKGDIILQTTEANTYTASLGEGAAAYGITKEFVLSGFYLIQDEWNTEEM